MRSPAVPFIWLREPPPWARLLLPILWICHTIQASTGHCSGRSGEMSARVTPAIRRDGGRLLAPGRSYKARQPNPDYVAKTTGETRRWPSSARFPSSSPTRRSVI